jgi:hypothetical protein
MANHLVADHPEIGRHISRHTAEKKITVIPYGADRVTSAPANLLQKYGLSPKGYDLLIARPEPENSILQIVRAYSLRQRGLPLVVLGTYRRDRTQYQKPSWTQLGQGSNSWDRSLSATSSRLFAFMPVPTFMGIV